MARKVALVTGASSGIGAAIAKKIANLFDLAVVSRDMGRLERLRSDLSHFGNVIPYSCDLADDHAIKQLVKNIIREQERVDVLVNCAGISGGGKTVENDDCLWQQMMVINLLAPMRLSREVIKHGGMADRAWGRIINVASTAGKQGVLWGAAYSASKHGLVGFTRSLGLELASSGITVNAICPGFVETPMAADVRERYASLWNVTTEEARHRIEMRVPLGRYIQPEEVAELAAYLISDAAAPVLGQAWNICGGLGSN
jgi:ketoreductase